MCARLKQKPITHYFLSVTDPRKKHNKAHTLIDITILAITGVLAGCESWVEIEQFGYDREPWLRTFLALPGGIPSHDTIGRVFSLIDPKQFQTSFSEWIRSVAQTTQGEVIAIDGKTNRRTYGRHTKPLHLVSAFATANGVSLGSVATDQKSNEITAIPELLKLLDIRGCLITTDAMGCQSDIAAEVIARGGEYLLAVKGNQGLLYRDIKACFADTSRIRTSSTTTNTGHGRLDIRVCEVMSGSETIAQLRHKNNWPKLQTIVKVTATRTSTITGETHTSTQSRYYICSLKCPTAERMQEAIRAHWGIENSLHWVLDMAMREDDSRIRKDHAPTNMAVLRHIALNLIRGDKTRKVGVKISQRKAGRNTGYMERLLGW